MAVLSKPGAQNKKLGHAVDRGTSGQCAAGDAARAVLEQLQKRSLGRVSAALVWSRARRFIARLCTCTLVPSFAYKYPGFLEHEEEEF